MVIPVPVVCRCEEDLRIGVHKVYSMLISDRKHIRMVTLCTCIRRCPTSFCTNGDDAVNESLVNLAELISLSCYFVRRSSIIQSSSGEVKSSVRAVLCRLEFANCTNLRKILSWHFLSELVVLAVRRSFGLTVKRQCMTTRTLGRA